jgi:hypothetical protein
VTTTSRPMYSLGTALAARETNVPIRDGKHITGSPLVAVTTKDRGSGSPVHHLNQIELSRRWRISPRTLERWRWLGRGPAYLKIGGRVAYRLEDVEAFETAQRHACAEENRAPVIW